MAENEEYDDDLYDPYGDNGGGMGSLPPVVSWKYSRPGDFFTGVVYPPDPVEAPERPYVIKREYKQENKLEKQEGGFTVWPPKGNVENIKRPVVEAEFKRRWPNEKMRKVSQPHFVFETGLTNGDLISDGSKSRMIEAEQDPNAETKRRIIEKGEDFKKKIAEALKAHGGQPQLGQTWKVGIKDRVANDYQGQTTIYFVEIAAPTPDTLKTVQEYVSAAQAAARQAADAADPSDPYAGKVAQQEEPPF